MHRLLILLFAVLLIPAPIRGEVLDVEAQNVIRRGSRIEAQGKVVIRGEGILLTANYVVYDTITEDLWAAGDCHLEEEGGELDAQLL
ncbi:MAG: hypothetical protein KBI48_11390, partial [Deltaproteobacteria bacterium]|nr:hypothetical protein [Deltaproteobacteria bacterium]